MSRLKKNQNIDNLIAAISNVAKNQCSLSDEGVEALNEALERLDTLKHKKGSTYKEIRKEVEKIVDMLYVFFTKE